MKQLKDQPNRKSKATCSNKHIVTQSKLCSTSCLSMLGSRISSQTQTRMHAWIPWMKPTHDPGKVFSFVDVHGGKVGEMEAMLAIPVKLGEFTCINLYGSWSIWDADLSPLPCNRLRWKAITTSPWALSLPLRSAYLHNVRLRTGPLSWWKQSCKTMLPDHYFVCHTSCSLWFLFFAATGSKESVLRCWIHGISSLKSLQEILFDLSMTHRLNPKFTHRHQHRARSSTIRPISQFKEQFFGMNSWSLKLQVEHHWV